MVLIIFRLGFLAARRTEPFCQAPMPLGLSQRERLQQDQALRAEVAEQHPLGSQLEVQIEAPKIVGAEEAMVSFLVVLLEK